MRGGCEEGERRALAASHGAVDTEDLYETLERCAGAEEARSCAEVEEARSCAGVEEARTAATSDGFSAANILMYLRCRG